MMLASPCSRAVRALAPIGKKSCSRALVSASGVPVESNCASIPALLPGTFKERQWTWEHDNDGSAEVQMMSNEAELTELIASMKKDALVVVKYSAVLCDACKAVRKRFQETAAEFGEAGESGHGKVHFVEVSFDSHRQLCDKMGIRSVPHVQIFSGNNGKIADFSIAPLKYNTLTSLLTERRDAANAGSK